MKCSLVTLAIAIAALGGCHADKPAESPESAKPVAVKTQSVRAQAMPQVVEGFGTLIAPPDHVAAVASATGGRVIKLLAKVGDRVRQGQPLVMLMADPAVQADLAKARITWQQAKLQRDREVALVAAGVAARMRADAAEGALATAQADLALKQQAAAIAAQNTVLAAPLSGVVTDAPTAIGAVLAPQAPAMMVSDLSALWAEVTLNAEALSKVRAGQRAEVVLDGNAKALEGRVVSTNRVLAQDTQRGSVRVALEGQSSGTAPGAFVRARIVTGSALRAAVPEKAVVMRDGQSLVYVVAGTKVRATAVQTGERHQADIVLTAGVRPGDRVVVENAYDLTDGAEVSAVEATR